jgi:outer membrane protein assembly factor BamB
MIRAMAEGLADGFVYATEAATGRPLWRFRAAPAERKIPVYGSLSSTWPVAGGVLVEKGVAYAAAGHRQLRRHPRLRPGRRYRRDPLAEQHLRRRT